MSNELDSKEVVLAAGVSDEATADLRGDNWQTPVVRKPLVKAPIHADGSPATEVPLTSAQIIAISKLVEEQTRASIKEAKFDARMPAQVVNKSAVPITDFSKLSMDAVYDLSIPIEAKEFMSADVLTIKLKDTNYEPRWVNKNPQRLGDMIARGFTYISADDLVKEDGIQTSLDAEGHYCFNDVVAMKIDKATYYRALRAAHLRAVATTDQAKARSNAAVQANSYMAKESGFASDYQSAAVNKKMTFYDPGVEV